MTEQIRQIGERKGDPIPELNVNSSWASTAEGAYCTYKNIVNNDTIATYGKLYNGAAIIDNHNLSPEGWQIPTWEEWEQLNHYLGSNSGCQTKETGTLHWLQSFQAIPNSSGFTLLPGGMHEITGVFINM